MRIVAFDVGEVRIGIAVCDQSEIAGFPVGVVTRLGSLKRDIALVTSVLVEQDADAVLIGLPLSLNGDEGPQALRVRGFAKALSKEITLPIVFWDESLSSVEATERMIAQGVSRERRRKLVDQMAASIILESYLAHRSNTGSLRDGIAYSDCAFNASLAN